MTLRNRLVRLAHEVPVLRPHLVPLLRNADADAPAKPAYKVGETVRVSPGTGLQDVWHGKVLGFETHFTRIGPRPFVAWYVLEKPDGSRVVVPPHFVEASKWDLRRDDEYAFVVMTKALRKAGLLNLLKRRAGYQRGYLGYEIPYGKDGIPMDEFKRKMLADPAIGPHGNSLMLTIPTGETETASYELKLESAYPDTTMFRRIEIGPLPFKKG